MPVTLRGHWLRLGGRVDPEVNTRVHALARALLTSPPAGVTDIVPSYTTVFIEYDAGRLTETQLRSWIEQDGQVQEAAAARSVTLRVRYGGPDLDDVATAAGLDVAEVIRRHTAVSYRVHALGFTPGFPFMGEVDPLIRAPRLSVPRAMVAAHSVGIADGQTGIYPLPSPGGWRLLGTALEAVYDPQREQPFLLEPGDHVTLQQADGPTPEPPQPLELLPAEPRLPILRVLQPGLLDLVVDRGRFLAGRFGLARSGPLDRRSAGIANRLVGNGSGEPLLELNLRGPALEIMRDCVLAFAGWGMTPTLDGVSVEPFSSFAARRGTILKFTPQSKGVRGYLAIAGGIESGLFRGSASTDARGLIGRPLLAGDVLGAATERRVRPGFAFQPGVRPDGAVTIRLQPGPQATPEALAALARAAFTVQQADRMGLRFSGEEVPGGSIISEANPLGAVQVTPGGEPLLLLHDRGTIGGYAKPAIVHPRDLPLAGQLRIGDEVHFRVTD
jgi:KipI family sensor histidine kinase inhibitor